MSRTNLARFVVAAAVALSAAVYLPKVLHGQATRVDGVLVIPVEDDNSPRGDDEGDATVKRIGIFSSGGQMQQRFLRAVRAGVVKNRRAPVSGHESRDQGDRHDDVRNVQINDPALDHIVTFDPSVVATRPFEFSTQSETSAVSDGKHVVVGYNSTANSTVQFFPGRGLAFTKLMFSGFSVSHDGGRTWTSGFVPSVPPDVTLTCGDPALAIDRRGNIFYASLGTDTTGEHGALIVNKSMNHGSTFGPAKVVAVDDGSDKEWMAIGPDPTSRGRDNIYITWTSFTRRPSSELWLARSTDGGQTFSSRRLFAPAADGANSAFIQFTNPVVDASTGRLYIPFLHFSNADADNVRVLVSDDGGQTFRFLRFDVAGAVDAYAFTNVTPGILNDCTSGGIRLALVAGPDQGGGRLGLPRFGQATRLIAQPHAAAARGTFVFVLNRSTSPVFGNGTGSDIIAVFTRDSGATWATTRVAASSIGDPQHVHPAILLSPDGRRVTVSYYVQQVDARLRTDVATLTFDGRRLRLEDRGPLSSTAFDLTPSTIVLTPAATTNYDRTVVTCYDIGEYQTLAASRPGDEGDDVKVIAAWGDNRRTWLSPAGSPAAGLHAQPDVFAATVGDESGARGVMTSKQ